MVRKLNSMRILERDGVEYRAFEFPESLHSGVEVAQHLQVLPEQVFKTIVIMNLASNKPILCMVPANVEVDLSLLAKQIGVKKVKLAAQRQAEELTGLKVGGISALMLLNRGWRCYIDQSATNHPWILISAGVRGMNLGVEVKGLISVTNALVIKAF